MSDFAEYLHAGLLTLFVLCSVSFAARSFAEENGFRVSSAETDLVDEVFLLDARIECTLTPRVEEALENGLPLAIEIEVEVLRDYFGVWRQPIAHLAQRYQLRYHALTRQYRVTQLNNGEERHYSNLELALEALGTLRALPMLDRRLLKLGADYQARLRARLDIESLPVPLRVSAYLSDDWRLTSAWYQWPLAP